MSPFVAADLYAAVYAGEQGRVRAYLSQGAPANSIDEHGMTPLDWAVQRGFPQMPEIVQCLLEHGACPHGVINGRLDPITQAIRYRNNAVLHELLDCPVTDINAQCKIGIPYLHQAIMRGDPQIVSMVLKKNPLYVSRLGLIVNEAGELVENPRSPLSDAVTAQNLEMIVLLFESYLLNPENVESTLVSNIQKLIQPGAVVYRWSTLFGKLQIKKVSADDPSALRIAQLLKERGFPHK